MYLLACSATFFTFYLSEHYIFCKDKVVSLSLAKMSAASTPVSRVRAGWSNSSLKNKGLSPAACSTPLLAAFPGNDDEQERRQRRRSRVIDLQSACDSSINDSASHR